jgi:preprotein translocase subunit SecB
MEITLAETRALEVIVIANDLQREQGETSPAQEDKFNLNFDIDFHESVPNGFAVVFGCKIQVERLREMRVTYLARYETSERVEDHFKETHFVQMNAPAIGYPYLRAFVGQMLLLSGYKPVTLPTINFKELFDRKMAEIKALEQSRTSLPN